jgi:hypothetical protein
LSLGTARTKKKNGRHVREYSHGGRHRQPRR